MQKMVDMKMPKRIEKDVAPATVATDQPRYPWGLSISLDDDSLTKLGITTLPEAGAELLLSARAKVTSIESRDTQGGGKSKSMGLQITAMCLDDGKNKADGQAKTMFPGAAAAKA